MTEASIDELSALSHEHNIEVRGFEEFARIFLPVILQPVALLVTRDGEGSLIEVDGLSQCEGKEGLGQGSVIFGGSEVVLQLRVVVLGVVRLEANRGPRIVL